MLRCITMCLAIFIALFTTTAFADLTCNQVRLRPADGDLLWGDPDNYYTCEVEVSGEWNLAIQEGDPEWTYFIDLSVWTDPADQSEHRICLWEFTCTGSLPDYGEGWTSNGVICLFLGETIWPGLTPGDYRVRAYAHGYCESEQRQIDCGTWEHRFRVGLR